MDTPQPAEPTSEAAAARAGVSRTVLVACVLAAALVAGVAGAAIGWKVEQQRVKDDLANIRPIGTIIEVEDGAVTVDLQGAAGAKTYVVDDDTRVDTPAGDDASSLEEGTVVLIRSRSDGDHRRATQIIVLPESAGRRG